jgi:hypothetical protein
LTLMTTLPPPGRAVNIGFGPKLGRLAMIGPIGMGQPSERVGAELGLSEPRDRR